MGPLSRHVPVRSKLFSRFHTIDHGFGTRQSPAPSDLVLLTQIHSPEVVIVEDRGLPPGTQGDALVTKVPEIAIGIATADCVPLLLYDPERRVIGAVHAGWKGIVKGIIGQTLEIMSEAFGVAPRDLAAGIGPAIGPCSYEVGEDVLMAVRGAFPWWRNVVSDSGPLMSTGTTHQAEGTQGVRGKSRLDLQASVAMELEDRGIRPDNIDRIMSCTFCSPQFHSYRRDGKSCGRQVSFIRLLSSLR